MYVAQILKGRPQRQTLAKVGDPDPRDGRPRQLIQLYDDGLVAARVDNSISSVDDYAAFAGKV
jgi:hypothetical protein